MDILSEICSFTRARVSEIEKSVPLNEVKRQALSRKSGTYAFENAIKKENFALICEIKKASPSKGVIDPVFDYIGIAKDYETGGADCISCLTEPKWFLGSDKIFTDVKNTVNIPTLRKDFIVSEYQIYQSKLIGADAVLLIMSALSASEAEEFFAIAEGLGMSSVFECRNEKQIELAQSLGGRIIGVNNRNLRDFTVDLNKARALRSLVDRDRIFVSESGVMSLNDLKIQKLSGADAALVGEFCMRAADRRSLIREMKDV